MRDVLNRFFAMSVLFCASLGTPSVFAEEVSNEIIIRPVVLEFGEDVISQLQEVVVGEIELLRTDPILETMTFRIPSQNICEYDCVTEIIEEAIQNGEVLWYESNYVGGQTGSLWVSGIGVDADGYRRQYAHQPPRKAHANMYHVGQ